MPRQEPQVNIRLPQNLKEAVHEMAAYRKRSVYAEIIAIIEKEVLSFKQQMFINQLRKNNLSVLREPEISEESKNKLTAFLTDNGPSEKSQEFVKNIK